MELNDRDQEQLLMDVEISCLPEVKGENPTHLAILIAEKLAVKLSEEHIVSAERMGPPRSCVEGEGVPKPRPLVVRLMRRSLRDQLVRSARVRRGVDSNGFNQPGSPRKFYFNERLMRTNRQLFYKVRQEASKHGWKYVWTRDGRI
ncbi:unnamed protein product [Parnassius apollo]|uniref:(apollo) hypothetical protein n=1 Tax=Parnassius apollo TaxID=110799 RepID=A0A8S3WCW3_PARAO|nr:unnamed protein product [Parnassius apollo]